MDLAIPQEVGNILTALEQKGREAYVVGGCVRDSLLGQIPHDWDICTAATPQEVMECFAGERALPTGLAHGTVTLIRNGIPYEITTFRIDGTYSDGRRPDQVAFVRDLREDLARRDFTINAMAYSPRTGVVDCFGGRKDLQERQIRAVREPEERFQEDGLRILRALRFAATYGFGVESHTASAARKCKNLMKNVSVERIFTEFSRLLCGIGAGDVLMAFPDIIGVFLPEILPAIGFRQEHPRHIYDVWDHTAKAISAAPPDRSVRFALLFHDLGKVNCLSQDERGSSHFYGHEKESAALCRKALKRLRCDKNTAHLTETLVQYHSSRLCPVYPPSFHPEFQAWMGQWHENKEEALSRMPFPVLEPGLRQARRWLNKLGEERLRRLLETQRADVCAQDAYYAGERLRQLENFTGFLELAKATNQCYCLRDLKVSGRDLQEAGFSAGPELGRILEDLLEEVVEGSLPNEREALLHRAAIIK